MTAGRISAAEFLVSTDPLSDTACFGLLAYGEEDHLVDFKEKFDPDSQKSWIELAIDSVAFANTNGGYIVFGVADKTWALTGLPPSAASALADTKKVLEKVNRGLAPVLTRLRCREISHDGKSFIIVASPCDPETTHIFESNLTWSPEPGKVVTVVAKGNIYVRRVASNQLLTSADFELLIERRLRHFREKILDGISRVVDAPPGHEIVTLVQGTDASGSKILTVADAPPTSDLVGRPLKLASDSVIEKIRVYQGLTAADESIDVPIGVLLDAYSARESLDLDEAAIEWVAYHSLRVGTPPFYWLEKMKARTARGILEQAAKGKKVPYWRKQYMLTYSGFYGKTIYEKIRVELTGGGNSYLRQFRDKHSLLNVGPSKERQRDSARATELATLLRKSTDAMQSRELEKLDCSLYAPFD